MKNMCYVDVNTQQKNGKIFFVTNVALSQPDDFTFKVLDDECKNRNVTVEKATIVRVLNSLIDRGILQRESRGFRVVR